MPFVPNEDNLEEFNFTIKGRVENTRIDQYLAKRYPDYSRAYVQKLIKKGHVLLDGKPAKMSARVRAGQEVFVSLPKLEPLHLKPEAIPLDILFEDEDLAVINKQVGYVVHPSRGHMHGTLVNALIYHFEELSDCNDEYRPGIVHRLDRDTSGVLLVAKSNQAHHKLAAQFESRQIKKEYLALAEGEIAFRDGVINLPLGMDPRNRERMAIQHGGKTSVTEYKVVARYPGFTLLHVFPKTGRTHQIRIHFKSQGHPLVGDHLYGAKPCLTREMLGGIRAASETLMARQALHSWKITFEHPGTHSPMRVVAPLAEDFFRTLTVFQSFWPSPEVAEILEE